MIRQGPSGPIVETGISTLQVPLNGSIINADSTLQASPRMTVLTSGAGLNGGFQTLIEIPEVAPQLQLSLADVRLFLGSVNSPPAGTVDFIFNAFLSNGVGESGEPTVIPPVIGKTQTIDWASRGGELGVIEVSQMTLAGAADVPYVIPDDLGSRFMTVLWSFDTGTYAAPVWLWGLEVDFSTIQKINV